MSEAGNPNNTYSTHVVNYSGMYQTGVNYKKFDIVHGTGDMRYYYARHDLTFAEALSTGSGRFSFEVEAPHADGEAGHYLYDEHDTIESEGFAPGQTIEIAGSSAGNDGTYTILDIEPAHEEAVTTIVEVPADVFSATTETIEQQAERDWIHAVSGALDPYTDGHIRTRDNTLLLRSRWFWGPTC